MNKSQTALKTASRGLLLAGVVAAVLGDSLAAAQVPLRPIDETESDGPNSSLYSGTQARQTKMQLMMAQSQAQSRNSFTAAPAVPNSFYDVPAPPPKEIRVNDIITIRVDLGSRVTSEGEVQRRKTGRYDAVLNDWLVLTGLRKMTPAPQSNGDQRVQANTNQQYRATAELETTESMKFEIAAKIAHILPNGNLVLEAHREIRNNNEIWIHSLTGVCRREDIGPGNFVLSKDLADLTIDKKEFGSIRDGYKRGWMVRFMDRFNPF